MTKILLTGTNSFIGRNFILCSKFSDTGTISLKNVSPEKINFSNTDVILHLAAIVHYRHYINEKEYFRINRDLTFELARAAKKSGVRQFIFLSTIKVYGKYNSAGEPWDESSPCFPTDPYGRSKYEAEQLLKELEDENFTVSIIRTPLVYGLGVKANMLYLMRLVEKFRTIPLGGIDNLRNFTCVENLTGFIDRIIEMRVHGTFIAMDEKPVSTSELIRLIADAMNRNMNLVKIPEIFVTTGKLIMPRLFEPLFGSILLNNDQTVHSLDFHPPVTTAEGIRKMVKAYLSQ